MTDNPTAAPAEAAAEPGTANPMAAQHTPAPAAPVDVAAVEEALRDVIEEQAQQALSLIADKVRIQWVWLPPWGPDKITPEGREQLRALGFNV